MDEFLVIPKFYFVAMGLWPIKQSKWIWFYYLHSFITVYVISFLFLFSLTIDIYKSIGDIGVVADASYFFTTEMTFVIKLLIFTAQRSKFLKLLKDIRNPMLNYTLPEQFVFMKQWASLATFYSKFFYGLCQLCLLFYAVFPLMDKDENNILPFRGWFPFDVKNSLINRTFVYLFQLLSLSIAIAVNCGLDVLPLIFMNIGCAQIEILKENIKASIKRAEAKIKTGRISRKFDDDNYFEPLCKEADDIVYKNLCTCIEHHIVIKKLLSDVNSLFSLGMFVQFLAFGVTMCITGLQLIVVPVFSLKYITISFYLFAVIIQISCYCYNGQYVIVQSSSIGEYCYNMDWYRCSARVKKTIFIIMERSKQPIYMTAGNFFILSFETLTKLMRSSYSYFAVIRNVYAEN